MTEIERIDQLREELHRHNYNYYVLNAPEITDQEFDKLMRELQDLEEKHPEHRDENSPSMRVGSDINKNFTQVVHKYPMLSLANTYSETEVTEFYDRVKKSLNEDFEICCEMKYDGTSISLTYENGKLVRAVTRGDGVQGDDVTGNVKTIRCIPLVLHGMGYPETFEIRGEILMPWVVFEELNKEREAREEPLFANPRNAASGTLKLQNSAIVASRKLDAYLYYLLGDNLPCDGHYENLKEAEKWGFKISDLNNDKLVCDGALYKSDPIKTKGKSGGKMINCYTLAKKFKPYLDMWRNIRLDKYGDSEWLFPDAKNPKEHIQISTINCWSNTFSRLSGKPAYIHSLRHYFTTSLAKAGIPDGVIQSIVAWESSDMVQLYKDIDADEQIGMYFIDGDIVAPEQKGLGDL